MSTASNRHHALAVSPPLLKKEKDTVRRQAITRIVIQGLFGLYDYTLGEPTIAPEDVSSLLILYGENGTGKTTLLRLIFHLLSPEDNRGHRTYIGNVPFNRLSVTLGGAVEVVAERSAGALVGTYALRFLNRGEVFASAEAKVVDGKIASKSWSEGDQERWKHVIEALRGLGLALYYLPDTRRSESELEETGGDLDVIYRTEKELSNVALTRLLHRRVIPSEEALVEAALQRVTEWVRQEMLRAANTGEATTHSIYTDLARRIGRTKKGTKTTVADAPGLRATLERLQDRSRAFSEFGLTASLDVQEIISILDAARPQDRQILTSVLNPYVDGLSAKLDALQTVLSLIRKYVDYTNSFLLHKTLLFDVSAGIQIVSKTGTPLAPAQLSSGEKQLLLLLSNTLIQRHRATAFLIDEPELSLNVKWQRKLIDSLLGLIEGSETQFIMATHSLELLARHREHVGNLESANPT